jgi:hypothetical protein
MDEDQAPSAPIGTSMAGDGEKATRPHRFGSGAALPLGLGVLGAILIAVIVVLIVLLTWVKPMHNVFSQPLPGYMPGEIETVRLDGPWLKMTDDQHGTVVGWSDSGTTTGDGMPHGAVAEFDLSMPTEQDGVKAIVSVGILVTPETELLMGGQPWEPEETGERSPVEVVFGSDGFGSDVGYDYLDMRELTVEFRREGDALIAESIDASTSQQESPLFWMQGY